MVDAAWLLIAERGLEGMSTREVLARTSAPRGSVYHHFPGGRTELIELAIERAQLWTRVQIEAFPAKTPADVVNGYIEIWRRVLQRSSFELGCAAVGVVTGGHEPGLLDRGAAAFNDAVVALAARYHEVGMKQAEADRLATLLVCAAEGAVVLCRAQRSLDPLTVVAQTLAESVG